MRRIFLNAALPQEMWLKGFCGISKNKIVESLFRTRSSRHWLQIDRSHLNFVEKHPRNLVYIQYVLFGFIYVTYGLKEWSRGPQGYKKDVSWNHLFFLPTLRRETTSFSEKASWMVQQLLFGHLFIKTYLLHVVKKNLFDRDYYDKITLHIIWFT